MADASHSRTARGDRRNGTGRQAARDVSQVRQAAEMTRQYRGWLVIWSPWRRAYTAFACFTPGSVVLDADAPSHLVEQMRQTELQAASASSTTAFQGRGM
jgi:hypothetical protein